MFVVYRENGTFMGNVLWTDEMFTQSEDKAKQAVDKLNRMGIDAYYEWVIW